MAFSLIYVFHQVSQFLVTLRGEGGWMIEREREREREREWEREREGKRERQIGEKEAQVRLARSVIRARCLLKQYLISCHLTLSYFMSSNIWRPAKVTFNKKKRLSLITIIMPKNSCIYTIWKSGGRNKTHSFCLNHNKNIVGQHS
jgi:hypothetical protein